MEYRILGRTGVAVSKLCMGTMSFGGNADKTESAAMYQACREAGINFFDCANIYNGGKAEEILGNLIRFERDEVVITSKFSFRSGPGVNQLGSSRLHMIREVEQSLKRLGTDRIDLYFIHSYDPFTDPGEVLRGMDDLVRSGKILYIGVSNWAAWQIMKALGISEQYGMNRIACIQPMYNLVKRQAEVELFPMARSENLGVITYSPLGGGLLARKRKREGAPQTGRFAEIPIYSDRYDRQDIYDGASAFIYLAESRGVSPATMGVAWVVANPAVTAPIIGGRNTEQLKASLAAADYPMDQELYNTISSLFPEPAPATDRLEEGLGGLGLRG